MKQLFAAASIVALTGCATAVNGVEERVQFESVPAGAQLQVNRIARGQELGALENQCETPCSVVLKRGPAYQARFSKQGCGPVDMRLYPQLDSAFYYAVIPDFWTVGAYDIRPNPVRINMTCGLNVSERGR